MDTKGIKDAMNEKRVVIGTRAVMKGLKRGHVGKVVYASNIPETTRQDLGHYSKLGIEAEEFPGDSLKLSQTCGKPFKILLIGIKK